MYSSKIYLFTADHMKILHPVLIQIQFTGLRNIFSNFEAFYVNKVKMACLLILLGVGSSSVLSCPQSREKNFGCQEECSRNSWILQFRDFA